MTTVLGHQRDTQPHHQHGLHQGDRAALRSKTDVALFYALMYALHDGNHVEIGAKESWTLLKLSRVPSMHLARLKSSPCAARLASLASLALHRLVALATPLPPIAASHLIARIDSLASPRVSLAPPRSPSPRLRRNVSSRLACLASPCSPRLDASMLASSRSPCLA